MGKAKVKKRRMTHKQANRTVQRMQHYCNSIVSMLNNANANADEAMASVFAVAVRIAKQKRYSNSQFLDEAESAWENLKKLPIDHDQLVLVDEDSLVPAWRAWALGAAAVGGWLTAAAVWALS